MALPSLGQTSTSLPNYNSVSNYQTDPAVNSLPKDSPVTQNMKLDTNSFSFLKPQQPSQMAPLTPYYFLEGNDHFPQISNAITQWDIKSISYRAYEENVALIKVLNEKIDKALADMKLNGINYSNCSCQTLPQSIFDIINEVNTKAAEITKALNAGNAIYYITKLLMYAKCKFLRVINEINCYFDSLKDSYTPPATQPSTQAPQIPYQPYPGYQQQYPQYNQPRYQPPYYGGYNGSVI